MAFRLLIVGKPEQREARTFTPVRYEATFWDGWAQKRTVQQCDDYLVTGKKLDGTPVRHMANTAPNVSYYSQLMSKLPR